MHLIFFMHKVEILYFSGCPNFRQSCDIVCKVLETENAEFELTIRPIKDETFSDNPNFIGSPTVIIDGKDVELCYNNIQSWGQPVDGLACRLYDCAISRACPSEEMILCALNQ